MKVAIGLGCSLGERQGMLELTVKKLAAHPGLSLKRVSRWVRTPPMRGGAARGWFLNGVALFESDLPLPQILDLCRALEARADRRRARHWGDRPLDLDILLSDGTPIATEALTVPHPGIGDRAFVLEPLIEVWPDAVDPHGRPYADYPQAPGPTPAIVGIMTGGRAR